MPYGLLLGKGGPSFTTDVLGPSDPKLGDRIEHGGAKYLFVYNAGGTQISTGQGCVPVAGGSNYSMTVSSVTMYDLLVGVCKNATIAAAGYGWVVTQGYTNIVTSANTGIAAGDVCVLAANGAFVPKASGIAFLAAPLVKALSTIASNASGSAYVSIS